MYWEVGEYINSVVLDGGRAAYGKNILSTLSTKLSWSHFCEIMRVKTYEGRAFYIQDSAERNLSVHALRKEISRKAFCGSVENHFCGSAYADRVETRHVLQPFEGVSGR